MNTLFSRELNLFGYRFCFTVRAGAEIASRLRSRNERVVGEYKNGSSIQNISAKFGLTPGRISQILVEQGARLPRWNRMTSRQRRLVIKLGRRGLSKSEIGRQVGISRTRVRQILRDGGLDEIKLVQV